MAEDYAGEQFAPNSVNHQPTINQTLNRGLLLGLLVGFALGAIVMDAYFGILTNFILGY